MVLKGECALTGLIMAEILSYSKNYHMSQCMRLSTMWFVRPAKPQISLRIRAALSETLLVALVFYDCYATD